MDIHDVDKPDFHPLARGLERMSMLGAETALFSALEMPHIGNVLLENKNGPSDADNTVAVHKTTRRTDYETSYGQAAAAVREAERCLREFPRPVPLRGLEGSIHVANEPTYAARARSASPFGPRQRREASADAANGPNPHETLTNDSALQDRRVRMGGPEDGLSPPRVQNNALRGGRPPRPENSRGRPDAQAHGFHRQDVVPSQELDSLFYPSSGQKERSHLSRKRLAALMADPGEKAHADIRGRQGHPSETLSATHPSADHRQSTAEPRHSIRTASPFDPSRRHTRFDAYSAMRDAHGSAVSSDLVDVHKVAQSVTDMPEVKSRRERARKMLALRHKQREKEHNLEIKWGEPRNLFGTIFPAKGEEGPNSSLRGLTVRHEGKHRHHHHHHTGEAASSSESNVNSTTGTTPTDHQSEPSVDLEGALRDIYEEAKEIADEHYMEQLEDDEDANLAYRPRSRLEAAASDALLRVSREFHHSHISPKNAAQAIQKRFREKHAAAAELALPDDPGDDFTDSESLPDEVKAVFNARTALAAKRAATNRRKNEVAAMQAKILQKEKGGGPDPKNNRPERSGRKSIQSEMTQRRSINTSGSPMSYRKFA